MCSKFVFDIDYRCTLNDVEFLLLMSIVIVFFLFDSTEAKIGRHDRSKCKPVKKQRGPVALNTTFAFLSRKYVNKPGKTKQCVFLRCLQMLNVTKSLGRGANFR